MSYLSSLVTFTCVVCVRVCMNGRTEEEIGQKAIYMWTEQKKKHPMHSGSKAGEETDEGDVESREVDYMSDSTSESEQKFQVNSHSIIPFWF